MQIPAPAETLSALAALALYQRQVLPAARRELRGWDAADTRMPNGALREAALEALTEKRSNPEATAVFAILAPRARRAGALRVMTALQVAIDYLDSLGEQPVADPLADGLALHGVLLDAVSPGLPRGEWYRRHPEREDGGYLQALVATCREELATLPASKAVGAALRRSAERCGEGQAHTHASTGGGQVLRDWAMQLPSPAEYSWWERAAGASSSVAAHALIAAAADPATTAEQAELIDATYFPSIGALTVLLDDLVDREAELAGGEHNYPDYYDSGEHAAERVALITARARAGVAKLPRAWRHGAILAGVTAFYLNAISNRGGYEGAARDRLLEAAGPAVRPIIAILGARGDG